jgi:hypothetical protein
MRSNLPLLTRIAQQLDPLLPELVFVGGATTELFFTSPAASEVRMTRDADVICEVAGRVEYHRLGERLRTLGFQEDTSPEAPLCRWTSDHGILDVMPVDEDILGFSNPWYERALSTANWVNPSKDLRIRVVSPPMFIATKLAAFEGRGEGDLLGSHDIEDIVVVIAYRDELVPEVGAEQAESRAWIRERIRLHLVDHPDSEYAITGSLPGAQVVPELVPRMLARVQALAAGE